MISSAKDMGKDRYPAGPALAWGHIVGAVQQFRQHLVDRAVENISLSQKPRAKIGIFLNGKRIIKRDNGPEEGQHDKNKVSKTSQTLCIEYTRGRKRVYKYAYGDKVGSDSRIFDVEEEEMTHRRRLDNMVADYLLPQGFPTSVAPQYQKYMTWRGVQYFFGGAMSVFTTRSLLKSLGVANRHSGEAAAAINWVVKDGAGRMGRFLFARWGRSLDCELKQFRLAGDFLMETGASLELMTALSPRLFLPLACTANLAKNLAAVAASSTRAPIYRTFAKANNMADITAKGESVANLADVFGTAFGIFLAKAKMSTLPTFIALSVGYLISSRKEVDSVELPYFNRARLSYAAKKYFTTGNAPGIREANIKEALLPWNDPAYGKVVLGASIEEACASPASLDQALSLFPKSEHILHYRKDSKKLFVLLRDGSTTESVLKGAFAAHLFIHLLDGGRLQMDERSKRGRAYCELKRSLYGHEKDRWKVSDEILSFVSKFGDDIYKSFQKQSEICGWKMRLTMLNPKDARMVQV